MKFAHDANRRMIRAPFGRTTSVLVVLVLIGTFRANPARAQAMGKVAVANPSTIFEEIQEKKDFVTKMTNDLNSFKTEQNTRAQKLKDQQTQRDMFKTDSPQYDAADQQLLQMTVDFELYVRTYQLTLERRRKKKIIDLFDKIAAVVGDVAKQKGLDLVVADVRPDLPPQGTDQFEQLNENQIKSLLAQRNVLFSSKPIDITADVIAKMDLDYKAGK